MDGRLRARAEEAAREAREVMEHPMQPPAEQVASLEQNVAAAQAAARAVVESGPTARELAAPTRNEQRRADEQGRAALGQVLESLNPRIYEGLIFLDSYLERYGFRSGGHLEIRIDLERVRAAGYKIDEEQVERDLRTNPEAALRRFVGLGVEGAVEIVQTGGAPGGLRPAGTRMEEGELMLFIGMIKRAEEAYRKIMEQEAGKRRAAGLPAEAPPPAVAYVVSGSAQA